MYHDGEEKLPNIYPGVYEETLLAIASTMKKRANNPILMCYCMIGKHIINNGGRFSRHKPIHRTAEFLYEYFLEDYPAINLLEDVSHSAIIEMTKKERDAILAAKSREDLQGLLNNGADDLWLHTASPFDFASFDFPEPQELPSSPRPLKRRRVIQDDVTISPPAVTELLDYRPMSPVSLVLFGNETLASLDWLSRSSLTAPVPRSPVQPPTATHGSTSEP